MFIANFVAALRASNTLMLLANNPAAQFGTPTRRLVGAELLPERQVSVNDYREEKIAYRTLVANATDRYSPAQIKGGAYQGSFDVHLAHSNLAAQFTAQDYDVLVRTLRGAGNFQGPLLQSQPGMQAVAQLTNWLDTTVVRGLIEVLEVWRWQAMMDGIVNLIGDNGFNDTIKYPRWADLHGAAGGNWSDDAYDPFLDIFARVTAMGNRGVIPRRIITGRQAVNKLLNNAKVKSRVGRTVINTSGGQDAVSGAATLASVNASLAEDGLPPIELYDLMYQTEVGAKFFLRRDGMLIVGTTGQDETIDLGNGAYETVENTIGYTAVGIAVGQATPGRLVQATAVEELPPHIKAEGAQTGSPVITAPEAFSTIIGIA